jgi:hypothetical protein
MRIRGGVSTGRVEGLLPTCLQYPTVKRPCDVGCGDVIAIMAMSRRDSAAALLKPLLKLFDREKWGTGEVIS